MSTDVVVKMPCRHGRSAHAKAQADEALELQAEKAEAQEAKTIRKAQPGKAVELGAERAEADGDKTQKKRVKEATQTDDEEEEEEEEPSACLQDLAPEYRGDAVVAAWVGSGRLRARDFWGDGWESDGSCADEGGSCCADFSDSEEFAMYDDEEEGSYPSNTDYPEALEADE